MTVLEKVPIEDGKKNHFLKMTWRTQGSLPFRLCIAFRKSANCVMLFPTLNMLRHACQCVEIFSELALPRQFLFFGVVRKYPNEGGRGFFWC